jgi:hypothetical protein
LYLASSHLHDKGGLRHEPVPDIVNGHPVSTRTSMETLFLSGLLGLIAIMLTLNMLIIQYLLFWFNLMQFQSFFKKTRHYCSMDEWINVWLSIKEISIGGICKTAFELKACRGLDRLKPNRPVAP